MVDIDCDGKRELVYTRYSRGLHCCLGLMIWSFKDDKPQLLYQHEYKDQGGFLLKDIDGDCSLELLFADDSWAYWKTDYSRSPSVGVELKLINGKYNYYNYTNVIADSLRHHKHDNGKSRSSFSEQYLDTYYDKVNKIREASGWMDYKLSDLSGYWEIILRLLGFGYTEEAYCFSLDAWNSTYNNYDNFMKQFNDNLYSSKHIGYLELKNPELRKYFK